MEPRIGLVLLAAGSSSRMGKPKQLLTYQGQTLLCHAVKAALASVCRPVVVVIGCEAEEMLSELTGLDIEIVPHMAWRDGIGSSIRWGIQALIDCDRDVNGAVMMLCDQPMVTADSINLLVSEFEPGEVDIVASEYDDSVGVPALFTRSLFPSLTQLPSDSGAKKLIASHKGRVVRISMPGSIDIDTPEDYNALVDARLTRHCDPSTGFA